MLHATVGIRTRYLGPSNYRGARIVADVPERLRTLDSGTDPRSRWRVTIPYPYELSGVDAHAVAARLLAQSLGWLGDGEPVALALDDCYVWSFPKAAPRLDPQGRDGWTLVDGRTFTLDGAPMFHIARGSTSEATPAEVDEIAGRIEAAL